MKSNPFRRWFRFAALSALVLAVSAGSMRAADTVLNRFDSASEVGQWRFDFGSVTHTQLFDPTADADGNGASGAMKITLGFDTALGAENKGAFTRDFFPGLDGATFSSMQMDLRVDAGSALDAFGNNGYFQLVIRNTGNYDYNVQFGDNIRSADGWRHISVSPLVGGVNDIRAVTWQLYGGPAQDIPGPVTLWIDNVVFTQVPEPSSVLLTLLGALVFLAHRRLRRAASAVKK